MATQQPTRRAHNFKDLTGQVFTRLTVLQEAGKSKHGQTRWLCQCECGTHSIILGRCLLGALTKSCGCLHREFLEKTFITHGMKHSLTYRSWGDMIQRTTNLRDTGAKNYIARGIRVCLRYRGFAAFLADLGERPPGKSLDRKENEGHYSCGQCDECIQNGWPMNCRWATKIEQSNNRRSNHRILMDGQNLTITEWAQKLLLNRDTIMRRLGLGWSEKQALYTPKGQRRQDY